MTNFYIYTNGSYSEVICEGCLQDWLVNCKNALVMENCELKLNCNRLSNPKFSFNRLQDMTIFCPDCMEVYGQDKELHLILDTEEWDCFPTCDDCHEKCEYVALTTEGLKMVKEKYCNKYKLDFKAYNPSGVLVFFDAEDNLFCESCAETNIDNSLKDLATGYEPYGLPVNQGYIYEDIDRSCRCNSCDKLVCYDEDEA